MKLYIAYGSNLNLDQMRERCPTAELYGIGTVRDYALAFKGYPNSAYATIAPSKGQQVPVAVWTIQPKDEQRLDRYEGYPGHYAKQVLSAQLDGEVIRGMVYIMNPAMRFALPSPSYYRTVYEGYEDCGLDTVVLRDALKESAEKYYDEALRFSMTRSFLSEDESEEKGIGMKL